MLFRTLAVVIAACASFASAEPGCNNCTNESPDPLQLVPAPWELKGDIYSFFLLPGVGIPLLGNELPTKAFPPLERQYRSAIEGDFIGTIGMVQIVRYTETPGECRPCKLSMSGSGMVQARERAEIFTEPC